MRTLGLLFLAVLPCVAQVHDVDDPDGLTARNAAIANVKKVLNDPHSSQAQKDAAAQTALSIIDMDTSKMIKYLSASVADEKQAMAWAGVAQTMEGVAGHNHDPSISSPTPSWSEVARFSGQGDKTTEPFNVSADRWRVVWKCTPSAAARTEASDAGMSVGDVGAFSAWQISSSSGDPIGDVVTGVQGSGNDSTEMHGAGTFQIKINSADDDWTIVIEEFSAQQK